MKEVKALKHNNNSFKILRDLGSICGNHDCLPSHPTKDGRATDSCFTLIGADQCGILLVNAGSKCAPGETTSVSLCCMAREVINGC